MEGMKRCISSGDCCVVRELKHCMIVCTVFRICMYITCFTSRTLWQVTSCPQYSLVSLFNKSTTIFYCLFFPWSLCVIKYSEDKQRSLLWIAAWSIFFCQALMAPFLWYKMIRHFRGHCWKKGTLKTYCTTSRDCFCFRICNSLPESNDQWLL